MAIWSQEVLPSPGPGSGDGCSKYRGVGDGTGYLLSRPAGRRFERCCAGDTQNLKESDMWGVMEKQAGNLLSLKH